MADMHQVLVNSDDQSIDAVSEFLSYMHAAGCSPNTVKAYGHDLAHLERFLRAADLAWQYLTPERAIDLLLHLNNTPSRRRGRPRGPSLAIINGSVAELSLSPATINRVLAAVSSFYDWARMAGQFEGVNPIARVDDRTAARVSERHRPFLTGIAKRQPLRRALRVKTVRRLPRPMSTDQVSALISEPIGVLLRLKVFDRLGEFQVILGKHIIASPERLQFPVDPLTLAFPEALKKFGRCRYTLVSLRGCYPSGTRGVFRIVRCYRGRLLFRMIGSFGHRYF
jgi:integrase